MNNEKEKITISVNEEDVQNLINCYEKDIKYIKQLEQERDKYKSIVDELNKWLEKHWEQSQDIWFVKIINKIKELEEGEENV